ncbi:hypothetical protein SH1V18_05540 [Vallitalea longa]|uniref:Uncharacterized protein n=1 Tax=Vallitalea longa TaxID=2936439 RepID=A0A9W5Y9X4_9FIRM|nr:hypothetical protein [Vallitalea longa]GKX28074.1 hypothetical protein SH1V18_05540 [Vallitalea longa]
MKKINYKYIILMIFVLFLPDIFSHVKTDIKIQVQKKRNNDTFDKLEKEFKDIIINMDAMDSYEEEVIVDLIFQKPVKEKYDIYLSKEYIDSLNKLEKLLDDMERVITLNTEVRYGRLNKCYSDINSIIEMIENLDKNEGSKAIIDEMISKY